MDGQAGWALTHPLFGKQNIGIGNLVASFLGFLFTVYLFSASYATALLYLIKKYNVYLLQLKKYFISFLFMIEPLQ